MDWSEQFSLRIIQQMAHNGLEVFGISPRFRINPEDDVAIRPRSIELIVDLLAAIKEPGKVNRLHSFAWHAPSWGQNRPSYLRKYLDVGAMLALTEKPTQPCGKSDYLALAYKE